MKKTSRNTSGSSKNSGKGGQPIRGLAGKSFAERQEKRAEKSSSKGSRKGSARPRQDNRDNKDHSRTQAGDRYNGPRSRPHEEGGIKARITLFGMHAVREAILNPERDIRAIYIGGLLEENIQDILDQAAASGIKRPEPEIVDKSVLDRALPRGTVHQGIGCDAVPLEEVYLGDIIRKSDTKERSVLIMLDQVTDPHNLGAIMRSACAFGADGVIVQSRHAPDITGIVAKTASGAAEHIPVIYETNLARTIDTLKEAAYFALALDERGNQTIDEAPYYKKTLLIMGAEGPGLRPLIRERCDVLLSLPTAGNFSSLNVSNAAAVALYAVVTAKVG